MKELSCLVLLSHTGRPRRVAFYKRKVAIDHQLEMQVHSLVVAGDGGAKNMSRYVE